MFLILPNIFTFLRIILILPLCVFILVPGTWANLIAIFLYVFSCVSDFLDGWLARRMDAESRFGVVMDPVADKMLVTAVIVTLIATQTIAGISVVAALIILLREIFVSGLRDMLGQDGITLPVSPWAKRKTMLQMVALGVLLFLNNNSPSFLWREDTSLITTLILNRAGNTLLWVAAFLAVLTAWDYSKKAWVNR